MEGLPEAMRDLPSLGFGFALVLARVGTAMLTGPGLGENEIPPTVRAGLAAVCTALVLPALRTSLPAVPDAVPELVALLVLEAVVGAWLGFMTRVLVAALGMAGNIVSLLVGLSSVLQIDPSIGTQVPALQRMLSLSAIALLFSTGLYLLPVQAIVGSYDLLSPGSLLDAGGAAGLVTAALNDSFALALRLAAPFIITNLVWQAALGFVSRLVPAIQVHLVSAPAQIVGGLALLIGAISLMMSRWSAAMTQSLAALPGL